MISSGSEPAPSTHRVDRNKCITGAGDTIAPTEFRSADELYAIEVCSRTRSCAARDQEQSRKSLVHPARCRCAKIPVQLTTWQTQVRSQGATLMLRAETATDSLQKAIARPPQFMVQWSVSTACSNTCGKGTELRYRAVKVRLACGGGARHRARP